MNILCDKKVWLSIGVFFLLMLGNLNSFAAEPISVMIIPFKINAEKDLTFLQEGIKDMLASRLFNEDRVTVLGREETDKAVESVALPLNEKKVREIGTKTGADYVLFGSLTVFGESVSIDAKLVAVAQDNPTLTFFNQTKDVSEVIPKINFFATEINEKVFNRIITDQPVAASQPVPIQTPETIYKRETAETPEALPPAAQDSADLRGFENPAGLTEESSHDFWKSQELKEYISGLALGDVNQDGKMETVFISSHGIHIYQADDNDFFKIKEIQESQYKDFIGIDIADINGNGTPELFITALNSSKNNISSMVLEWNGQDYILLVESSLWYYRVIQLPKRGDVLLGQKNDADDPFSGEIFEMAWQNTTYVPRQPVVSSHQINLMGAAFGDVTNTGKNMIVAYNKNDYLQIIDMSGNVVWTGSERFGGSNLYYLMRKNEPGSENRQYLPMRLYLRDMNGDGKNEVIAAKNYEMAKYMAASFRKFTDMEIASLSWNGLELVTDWKTKKNSGCISDFAIGDFDNDGHNELVAAVIVKDGSIIGTSPVSTIIAYKLNK